MMSRLLLAGFLWLALTTASKQAGACQPPESPATFVINHETYGDIGTHVLTFDCEGDDLIVETKVDVKVKVLFITVYEREARYREVWRGDRLIAYEARTDDGGDEYVTTAKIGGDAMIVAGVGGDARVPLDTVSSHPWNIDVVDRPLIFGQRDGRIHKVQADRVKSEMIKIGGKRIEAQKFVVQGGLERELLYGPDGTWLQWRLERDGKTVTITRQ
ncbi:MAG: DUF6134 family protein [Alphaproteobacteria bacterium]|nr:DUF6134 family protein [Alphaproteobacteria bacterium]